MRGRDAPPRRRPTICLNMIVKDEAAVIERCLRNAIPLVDAWCIVDTGSTDGTQEIVRRVMGGMPGDLHERPWKNFGHNRTEAIRLAAGKADWILTIDADETLERGPDFDWSGLTGDAALIEKRRGARRYRVMNLARDGLDWFWNGAVHEHLDTDAPHTVTELDGIAILSPREGARARDPMTYRRDALMLEEALLDDPDNTRNVFYLAQSYRDAEEWGLARRYYLRRAAMGGWSEEVFASLYQAARAMMLDGAAWPDCLSAFLTAHGHSPRRAEPLFEIGMAYARRGEWANAWLFLERAAALPRPDDLILFVEDDVHSWRAAMEGAVAAYWAGQPERAAMLNRGLLEGDALPEALRARVRENLAWCEGGEEEARRTG